MPNRPLSALLLVASLAPACIDADPSPHEPGGELGAGGCVEEVTILAGVDAASALGFSAADVLAHAEGEHTSAMIWSGGTNEGVATVELGPEVGAGELTVTIDYAGGEVRYIQSSPKDVEEGSLGGFSTICNDRLEIDVAVDVASAGGGLAESFTAALRATTRGIATLHHEIAFADLQGSLAVTKVEPAHATVGPVELDLGISPSGLFGGASALLQVEHGGAVGVSQLSIARWPGGADPCAEYGQAPVALNDAIAGFSAADALALVAKAPELTLTWKDAQPTAMDLELTHDGSPVCAVYEGDGPLGALRFSASAAVTTDDGRWDGEFPLEVSAHPGPDGALASVRIYIPAAYLNSVPAADFLDTFGLADIDLTGYDEGSLDFSGEFTPAGEAAVATGQVTAFGVKLHNCSDEPGGGCPGNDYVELANATWASQ